MCLVRCLVVRHYHGSTSVFINLLISTGDYVPTVPQPLYLVEGPVTDDFIFSEWSAQMQAYLRLVGYLLIINGTTTTPTDPAELQKWTLSNSMANGKIELRCSLNIRDLIAATSAATWTAMSNAFGATGVSRLFRDFKAVTQFRFSGMQHPAAEISHFNTHNQCLVASGVTLSGYILGMLLLAILYAPPGIPHGMRGMLRIRAESVRNLFL